MQLTFILSGTISTSKAEADLELCDLLVSQFGISNLRTHFYVSLFNVQQNFLVLAGVRSRVVCDNFILKFDMCLAEKILHVLHLDRLSISSLAGPRGGLNGRLHDNRDCFDAKQWLIGVKY